MSSGVDLSEFFDTFFDEADELLADMERLLLGLDLDEPDSDDLNGIFRAAHSIKGGAGTFGCFEELTRTTHLLENLLDLIRHDEMALRQDMVDTFLRIKDVLSDQVAAYRDGQKPDQDVYEKACADLQALTDSQAATDATADEKLALHLKISNIKESDIQPLSNEMALMGTILHSEHNNGDFSLWLDTTTSQDDIEAVCCFIVDAGQIAIDFQPVPDTVSRGSVQDNDTGHAGTKNINSGSAPDTANSGPAGTDSKQAASAGVAQKSSPGKPAKSPDRPAKNGKHRESSTIRVGVEKVDQMINLVGELVITKAMLAQTTQDLDPVIHDRLLNGIEQLERNARDLQDSVMSIRMVPMEYVFSRFPRVVHENASRMGKKIRLITEGQATELDKSLIERIIDPLTHLVRNSLDHGIELPEVRTANGKPAEGTLTLSAKHNGGHIIIDVIDDGAGLDREKIFNKALEQGFAVTAETTDDELWQLIFAPGFSTAKEITDISGRGVGMDVVRRNIQSLGGHVHLSSRAGQGTTTRIVLPLTLAILDGMSVMVGRETFILPLSHVVESMQVSREQIHTISRTEQVLHVRGEYLPIVALHEVFDVAGAVTDLTQAIAVILKAEDTHYALIVDSLIGQHQVVVKNLETNYRKVPGISAATILGDGSVALIVDVFALRQASALASPISA